MPSAFGAIHPSPAFGLDRLVENRLRLDSLTLQRGEGAITRWRLPDGLEIRATFRSPVLTLEYAGAKQQIEIFWHRPNPSAEIPYFACGSCNRRRARYLYQDGETFRCRFCVGLDYSVRHVGRHTPQLARLARLRRKLGVSPEPFAALPPLMSVRPKLRRLLGEILVLERGVLAKMEGVVDDLERRARAAKLLPDE